MKVEIYLDILDVTIRELKDYAAPYFKMELELLDGDGLPLNASLDVFGNKENLLTLAEKIQKYFIK